ncbi:MAG: hypothetical protein ACKOB0_10925, partial [Chthoniobacterales bacterium]
MKPDRLGSRGCDEQADGGDAWEETQEDEGKREGGVTQGTEPVAVGGHEVHRAEWRLRRSEAAPRGLSPRTEEARLRHA